MNLRAEKWATREWKIATETNTAREWSALMVQLWALECCTESDEEQGEYLMLSSVCIERAIGARKGGAA